MAATPSSTAYRPPTENELREYLATQSGPTKRWHKLWPHPVQRRLVNSKARFKVIPAGRRSGKTERAKRFIVRSAAKHGQEVGQFPGRYFCCAPTQDQAKHIYWADIRALTPKDLVAAITESPPTIKFYDGTTIGIAGLDRPQRIEGDPIDGLVIDEFADVKVTAWGEHIRPALSTPGRPGWAWLLGVPEGRGYYYDLWRYAISGEDPEWEGFTWVSADIVPTTEVESARRSLDERTFQQEYEAKFVDFAGRIYYSFDAASNVRSDIAFSKRHHIVIAVDYGVDPFPAVLMQTVGSECFAIDEVTVRDGNVNSLAAGIAAKVKGHPLSCHLYDDAATGRSRMTGRGKTWRAVLIEALKVHGVRVESMGSGGNPPPADRYAAVNSMFRSASGEARYFIHPRCKELIEDYEKCCWKQDGSSISKVDLARTHHSDGSGYYVFAKHRPSAFRDEPNYQPGRMRMPA